MRQDGLTYPSFYVCQLFGTDGYHSSIKANSPEQLTDKVKYYSDKKGIVACSRPFKGRWVAGYGSLIPDVSMPADWKEAFAKLNKETED